MSLSPSCVPPHHHDSHHKHSLSTGFTTADLRDFLVVQLRSTDRAISTSELRRRARERGFPGALIEGAYRLLVTLERRGQAQRVASRGRSVFWVNANAENHPAAAIERFLS